MNLLKIVNEENKLDANFIPNDLKIINDTYLTDKKAIVLITAETLEHFIDMQECAKKNNVSIYIKKGYLSYNDQIIDNSSIQGSSEFQLGTSIEIQLDQHNIDYLKKYAHNFGFILRYPEDKVDVTKKNYNSLIYRYVGLKIATIMFKSNLVIEEINDLYTVLHNNNIVNINHKDLKKNITKLDTNLNVFLESKGYSISWLNNLIHKVKSKNDSITRESIVEIANILTTTLEDKFSINLPYSFGGGHTTQNINKNGLLNNHDYNLGVNPNWGYKFNENEIIKHPTDDTLYTNYGIDCSGLFLVILKLLGFDDVERTSASMYKGYINNTINEIITPIGEVHFINPNEEKYTEIYKNEFFQNYYKLFNDNVYLGQPGDLLIHSSGHLMIITEVDEFYGSYKIVESVGQSIGIRKNTITIKYLIENKNFCLINIDELIKNPEKVITKYNLIDYAKNKNISKNSKKI